MKKKSLSEQELKKNLLETFKKKEHRARKWLLIDLDPKSNTGNGLIDQLNSV
jgi:hypothetical protein